MIKSPEFRDVFAVVKGSYIGEMLILVDKKHDDYCFLSVPKNINRNIPIDNFLYGVKRKIVEFVETLPEEVYNVIKAQYQYNEKSNNRREQSTTSGLLDSNQ